MGTCQTACCAKDNEFGVKPNQKDELQLQVGNPDDLDDKQHDKRESPVIKGQTKDREKFQVDNDENEATPAQSHRS